MKFKKGDYVFKTGSQDLHEITTIGIMLEQDNVYYVKCLWGLKTDIRKATDLFLATQQQIEDWNKTVKKRLEEDKLRNRI